MSQCSTQLTNLEWRLEGLSTMDSITFSISGLPGTYATAKEAPWKKAIYEQAPRPSLRGKEIGLRMSFTLPTLTPWGQPLDVDNLCEPVFSVLIDRIGWFSKSRSNLLWWQATKEEGIYPGCRVTVHTTDSVILPQSEPDYDETYTGNFPRNAKSPELSNWAWKIRQQKHIGWIPEKCLLYLDFSDPKIDIGSIRNYGVHKPTKPIIDCLYPWYGGPQGNPYDHCIMNLAVSKSQAIFSGRGVTVRLWAYSHIESPLSEKPVSTTSSTTYRKASIKPKTISTKEEIVNPCIQGTRKWIVCEGALSGKTVGEVQFDLDSAYKGSGRRLKEYISDLRSENQLDIRIDNGRVVCYGRI